MKAKLITAPTVEPVTFSEVKNHLRVETDDFNHDAVIRRLIKAARNYAEGFCGRAIIQQTWDYWLDRWPAGDAIELPKPPLNSVTSVSYTDSDGNSTSLVADTDYVVDTDSMFGRVILEYGKTWPTATLHPKNPIKIRFVAGYDDDGSSPPDYRANIPEDIKHALLLLIGDWFSHRENTVPGISLIGQATGVDALLYPHKAWRL